MNKTLAGRPSRGYVDTPEGQIHFRRCGAGPAVILLHQAPSSSSMWLQLLPELAARGHEALAFDLPGYGMSDPPPQQPDIPYYARRIEAAAVALGYDQFDLVGHHTGSLVALWLATTYPQRVRRMVTYGLCSLDEPFKTQLAEEAPPDYEAEGHEVLSWWKVLTQYIPLEQAATLVPRYAADMLLSGENRAYGHRAAGRCDPESRLSLLNTPVLSVAGRKEILYEGTRRLAQLSPSLQFHEFGDAGIFAADEQPAEFAQLIHEFLGEQS